MKKLFLLAMGFLLTLAACQQDESIVDPASQSSFTVEIPQTAARAVTDQFGTGTSVNRCILEIYHGDQLYNRIEKGVTQKTVTFDNLRLVSSQTYDFVFWADCATASGSTFTDKAYNTTSLKNITNQGNFVGNSDERDAFFAKKTLKVTGTFTENITLTRPFGLLIVKTNDLNEIKEEALKPTGYTVNFKGLPNTFNAFTGEVSGSADVTYTANELAKNDGTISMDFLWASENESALSDFTMTFLNGKNIICTNDAFTNIPIRRNYKTNVSGNLLTKQGNIEVTINPEFNTPDYELNLVKVESASDVKAALESGATDIVVNTLSTTEANEIIIPKIYAQNNQQEISLTLPETTADVTIKYDTQTGTGTNTEAPANITLTANTTGKTIIIAPQSTVILKGSYGEIDATTAENTLVIPEGVTVNKLNIKKGNVEIYGTVNEINFEEGAGLVKTYAVGDAATLKKAATLVSNSKCARIVLTADINLEGSASNLWEPINAENNVFTEFDGANHTISNLYVDNYTGKTDGKGTYYGGLFYVLRGTVKDLTIDQANVTCFRGGVLVGRMDYGTVENCHIKNAKVSGIQKLGGLVGFVSASNKDITVKSSSVDGLSINTKLTNDGLYQAGGFIGYLQTLGSRNVFIEGNSVNNITLGKVSDGKADAPSYGNDLVYVLEQNYSHAFIGTIANLSKTDVYNQYKVELKNNTVAQQIAGIPTCDRTDKYIGWWSGEYNAAGYPYSVKVVVDGVEKNRWIEVERFVKAIKAGGNVIVWRSYDLTRWPETTLDNQQIAQNTITIEKGTTLNLILKKNAILTVGKQQLENNGTINVEGTGAMAATDYIFMNNNGATLNIKGGTFTATKATDANGVVIYNQGICNITDGTFNGSGFTLMNNGNANMTIDGGWVKNGGTTTSYAMMGAGSGVTMTVNGGKIEAMQSIRGAKLTINNGTIYQAHNRYYALYNEGGNSTINGGYLSGASGFKDIYISGGKVNIKGGCFEDNQTPASAGFNYVEKQQTVDGRTYNYEVVKAN